MEGSNIKYNSNSNIKNNLKFILPSLLGIILFMIPIKYNDKITIPVAIFSNALVNFLGSSLIYIITFILVISAVISIITKIFKPKFILENSFLKTLFNVGPLWLLARIFGAIFRLLTLFGIGSEFIIGDSTGAFVLNDLLTVLFSIFLFAGLLLPLLLNFGLLEFFGSLLTKVLRPIFKLPGRSSIDCITSWLGDGTLGILLTSKQYEDGFYTKEHIENSKGLMQCFTFPWMNSEDIIKTPKWVNDTVWYQIFPERFCYGDATRNPESVKPWAGFNDKVSNEEFRLMIHYLPGPYAFVLQATSKLPNVLMNRRKTIGIRIPKNFIVQAIVEELGGPLLTTSVKAAEGEVEEYITDPELIHEKYNRLVDLVIDGGYGNNIPSTVIDCTGDEIVVTRQGLGEL